MSKGRERRVSRKRSEGGLKNHPAIPRSVDQPMSPDGKPRNFTGLKKALALLALLNMQPNPVVRESRPPAPVVAQPLSELDASGAVSSESSVKAEAHKLAELKDILQQAGPLGEATMWQPDHRPAVREARDVLSQFPLEAVINELAQLSSLSTSELLSHVQLLGIDLYSPTVMDKLIAESASDERQDKILNDLKDVFGRVDHMIIKGQEVEAMSLNVGLVYNTVGKEKFSAAFRTVAMHELIHAMHTTSNNHLSDPIAEALVQAVQDKLVTRLSRQGAHSAEFGAMAEHTAKLAFAEMSYGYMLLETAQQVGINGVKELMQDQYSGLFERIVQLAPEQSHEQWQQQATVKPPQTKDRGFICGMQTVLLNHFPVETQKEIVSKINSEQKQYHVVLVNEGNYRGILLRDAKGQVRNGWVVHNTQDRIFMRSLAQQWPAAGYSQSDDGKRFFQKQQGDKKLAYVYQSLDVATTSGLTDEQVIAQVIQQYP